MIGHFVFGLVVFCQSVWPIHLFTLTLKKTSWRATTLLPDVRRLPPIHKLDPKPEPCFLTATNPFRFITKHPQQNITQITHGRTHARTHARRNKRGKRRRRRFRQESAVPLHARRLLDFPGGERRVRGCTSRARQWVQDAQAPRGGIEGSAYSQVRPALSLPISRLFLPRSLFFARSQHAE